MESHEILPAIPMQKVKHCMTGDIGSVLALDETRVVVLSGNPIYVGDWQIDDCQPVPEEPRPFRVGDSVVALDCDQSPKAYFKIQTLENKDGKIYAHGSIFGYQIEIIRHATPEELAKYF